MEKIRQESQHTAVPGETICCNHRASSPLCDIRAGSDLGSPNSSLPWAQAIYPVEAGPSASLWSIPPSRAVTGQMLCLLFSWPCSVWVNNDWLNFEWWLGQFSRGQDTCSASSPSVGALIAERLVQAPAVCSIISSHSFLKQRSNSLIKPCEQHWSLCVIAAVEQGNNYRWFLNYRIFIWQWLQIWAVIPTTGNAFFTVGVT